MNMQKTKPSDEQALIASKLYIQKKHNPLESNGYLTMYYVVVGMEDEMVYAEELPLTINSASAAREFFKENYNHDMESLVKVITDRKNSLLDSELVSFFP